MEVKSSSKKPKSPPAVPDNDSVNNVNRPPVPARRQKQSEPPQMTEEEFIAALRNIVNPSNPRDRYRVIKQIGLGASGKVFTATDKLTNTTVAIKTMNLFQQPKIELILSEIIVLRENRLVLI